ncbi:hypothetical protein SASPL_137829 [Salvia splendens]|uniref:Zinc transporter, ZIP family n=1 Tax=Salvia splendens TaxID=180675 RepID=A0A8X8WUD5_SALSN|nr:hypothetical protein SASPL_137829 [Salvia splendens]
MEPGRFSELADPLLRGDFPKKSFNQAVAISAMCLQEDVTVRPLISDVVTALSCLPLQGDAGYSCPISPPSPNLTNEITSNERDRAVAEAIAWGSKSRHNCENYMGLMDSQVLVALALSLLGGFSTSIGALFVVLSDTPNLKTLGLLQGFAAGLMLSISFLDLAHNAINSIGFLKGNLWFFAGVIFFAVIANFIPEPKLAPVPHQEKNKKNGDERNKDIMKKHRRQVLFSGIITAVGISLHNFPEGMAVFLGSMKDLGYFELSGSLAIFSRHPDAWAGEISIGPFYNFSVISQGLRVGLNLALAISLHNIPEGVAVALPIYFATKSKWQAFKLATLSGFAEPLGVIVVAYLFPSSLNPEILEGLLASVGGVMAFLTLHEMLPLAIEYSGQKRAVKAVFVGMAFMSARYCYKHFHANLSNLDPSIFGLLILVGL